MMLYILKLCSSQHESFIMTFVSHGTEISSRSSVKVEGDKRLDKLESFLDKLHSKGTVPWI